MGVKDLLIKMIKRIDLLEGINDDEAYELAEDFKLEYYQKGDVIIKQGSQPDSIYILKDGNLEARQANGLKSKTLGKVEDWEIFGEMSCLREKKAMASVVAIEDSDVWEISKTKFKEFLDKYPYIMDKVYEIMQKRDKENKNNTD